MSVEKGKLHRHHNYQHHPDQREKNPIKIERKPMKIKYISSPIMVNTRNVAEFRAIVQLLTGKSSNVICPADGNYTMLTQGPPSHPALPNDHNTPPSTMPTDHQELKNTGVSNSIFEEGDHFQTDFSDSLLGFLYSTFDEVCKS
jgi:hypothetical protein